MPAGQLWKRDSILATLEIFIDSARDVVAGVRALLGGRRITVKLAESALLIAHIAAYLTAVFLVLSPLQAAAFIVVHQGLFGI
jgi:hypothetical protein